MYTNEIKFGKLMSIVALVFFIILEYIYGYWSTVLITFSVVFFILTYLSPVWLIVPSVLWLKFGYAVGRVMNPVILGVIYFFIIGITSILMKFFKYDPLKIKKSNQSSFWTKRDLQPTSFKRMW
tara:strand:- start:2726 stop:3097 length:372 start_codon:yes stop_codon:yes gene_type:complete